MCSRRYASCGAPRPTRCRGRRWCWWWPAPGPFPPAPCSSGGEAMIVNSADSHVVEPLDLWETRLPPGLRERAPRRIEQDGRWLFVIEGMRPRRMGPPDQGDGHFRAGAGDPDLRIADLDADGVWGEVLYPTVALFGFLIPDPELRWACARAYNDWLAETF